jgi:hypothetical protein
MNTQTPEVKTSYGGDKWEDDDDDKPREFELLPEQKEKYTKKQEELPKKSKNPYAEKEDKRKPGFKTPAHNDEEEPRKGPILDGPGFKSPQKPKPKPKPKHEEEDSDHKKKNEEFWYGKDDSEHNRSGEHEDNEEHRYHSRRDDSGDDEERRRSDDSGSEHRHGDDSGDDSGDDDKPKEKPKSPRKYKSLDENTEDNRPEFSRDTPSPKSKSDKDSKDPADDSKDSKKDSSSDNSSTDGGSKEQDDGSNTSKEPCINIEDIPAAKGGYRFVPPSMRSKLCKKQAAPTKPGKDSKKYQSLEDNGSSSTDSKDENNSSNPDSMGDGSSSTDSDEGQKPKKEGKKYQRLDEGDSAEKQYERPSKEDRDSGDKDSGSDKGPSSDSDSHYGKDDSGSTDNGEYEYKKYGERKDDDSTTKKGASKKKSPSNKKGAVDEDLWEYPYPWPIVRDDDFGFDLPDGKIEDNFWIKANKDGFIYMPKWDPELAPDYHPRTDRSGNNAVDTDRYLHGKRGEKLQWKRVGGNAREVSSEAEGRQKDIMAMGPKDVVRQHTDSRSEGRSEGRSETRSESRSAPSPTRARVVEQEVPTQGSSGRGSSDSRAPVEHRPTQRSTQPDSGDIRVPGSSRNSQGSSRSTQDRQQSTRAPDSTQLRSKQVPTSAARPGQSARQGVMRKTSLDGPSSAPSRTPIVPKAKSAAPQPKPTAGTVPNRSQAQQGSTQPRALQRSGGYGGYRSGYTINNQMHLKQAHIHGMEAKLMSGPNSQAGNSQGSLMSVDGAVNPGVQPTIGGVPADPTQGKVLYWSYGPKGNLLPVYTEAQADFAPAGSTTTATATAGTGTDPQDATDLSDDYVVVQDSSSHALGGAMQQGAAPQAAAAEGYDPSDDYEPVAAAPMPAGAMQQGFATPQAAAAPKAQGLTAPSLRNILLRSSASAATAAVPVVDAVSTATASPQATVGVAAIGSGSSSSGSSSTANVATAAAGTAIAAAPVPAANSLASDVHTISAVEVGHRQQ